MRNCLKSQLKSVVNNDNLEFLDYLTINVHSVTGSPVLNDMSFRMQYYGSAQNITIEGNGHFTNADFTSDLGKSATIPASSNNRVIFSNGDYKIKLPIKNIAVFKVAQDFVEINNWQPGSINYERLFNVSGSTLVSVSIINAAELMKITSSKLGNPTSFAIVNKKRNDSYNLNQLIQHIFDSGRTTNFSIWCIGYEDAYGVAVNAARNIHYVSSTSYECYNGADTEKLYTANKINGVWQYTMA